jgi:hypothetical protein
VAAMKKILFLDFDGVLNYTEFLSNLPRRSIAKVQSIEWWTECLDPSRVQLVNEIVEKTGAEVVISSSWRHAHQPIGLQAFLEYMGFAYKIIGVTPRGWGDRRDEIRQWLQENGADRFVILDDDDDASIDGHFVQTNMETGLTPEHAQKAIEILNR